MQLVSRSIKGKLNTTLFSCELTDDAGIVHTKVLSYEDYVNWLADSARLLTSNDYIRLYSMPKGYIDALIKDEENFTVFLDYPAQKRDAIYMKQFFPKIPYPSMVFKYTVRKGEVTEHFAFCYKGKLTEESLLFLFPFGNISSTGHMCYGNIKIGRVTKLVEIDRAVSLFFDGEMSNDYFYPGESHCGNESLQELLEKLKKEEYFPEKILIPKGITLKEFMRK